jgi:hypothetical protein
MLSNAVDLLDKVYITFKSTTCVHVVHEFKVNRFAFEIKRSVLQKYYHRMHLKKLAAYCLPSQSN